jgi:hypothetical protein
MKIPKTLPKQLDDYECFRWVSQVIESCETFQHCNSCNRLIENYYHMFKTYNSINIYYNILVSMLEDKYTESGLQEWYEI